ncbi:MAG TPA: hypothetical protein VLC53_19630, partial [Myxococcota bacterium]|nr:hypothetical protein [Myxococcota bacterium]
MSRTDLFWAAATVALLCWDGPVVAAESLKAIGEARAGAHADSDEGQTLLTPGPGSLTITAGAAASDAVSNSIPPPDGWDMQAMVTGIASARYGSLAGRAHAEASSLPLNSSFLAGGQVSLNVGFTDGAEVVSDTLEPGTPVTLTFFMTLEATAVHSIDGQDLDPDGTGAAARLELEVRDLDDIAQPSGEGALVINSVGTHETVDTFEFDTSVGHRVEIVADLFVAAGVDVDYLAHGFSQGTAD